MKLLLFTLLILCVSEVFGDTESPSQIIGELFPNSGGKGQQRKQRVEERGRKKSIFDMQPERFLQVKEIVGIGNIFASGAHESQKLVRIEADELFSQISTSTRMSDHERQRVRIDFYEWKKSGGLFSNEAKETLQKFLESNKKFSLAHLVKEHTRLSRKYHAVRAPRPMAEVVPMLTLFVLGFLGALVVLGLALFWKLGEMFHFIFIAAIIVVTGLRITNFAFWMVSVGEAFAQVGFVAADLVERIGSVSFFVLVAMFAFFVFRGGQETYYPHERKRLFVVGSVLMAVTLGTVIYAIAMAVIVQTVQDNFVFDASRLVLGGVTVLICGFLVFVFGLTILNLRKEDQNQQNQQKKGLAMKNAWFMFWCSVAFFLLFCTVTVLAFLYTFISVGQYSYPYFFIMFSSEALFVFSLLAYIFTSLYFEKKVIVSSRYSEGYLPLTEEEEFKEHSEDSDSSVIMKQYDL